MGVGLEAIKIWLDLLGIKGFEPRTRESVRWLRWVTYFVPATCRYCADQNGKVIAREQVEHVVIPVHPNCRCHLEKLLAILAGTATIEGQRGADYWIKHYQRLPGNYLTKGEAEDLGWENFRGNLREALNGVTIGGNQYYNRNGKLPNAPGRIWREADINYTGGYRNGHRIYIQAMD